MIFIIIQLLLVNTFFYFKNRLFLCAYNNIIFNIFISNNKGSNLYVNKYFPHDMIN